MTSGNRRRLDRWLGTAWTLVSLQALVGFSKFVGALSQDPWPVVAVLSGWVGYCFLVFVPIGFGVYLIARRDPRGLTVVLASLVAAMFAVLSDVIEVSVGP